MTGRGAPGTSSGRPQSAVLVPVPEAEELVGRWRRAHDPVAPAGVPAHVTLVVPWLAPDAIDDDAVADLAAALAGVASWEFRLDGVGWFGRRVLWLAPEPADPFRALTLRLADRFGTPPWGGAFDEVVPHLTVAHATPGDDLAPVADAVAAGLPLACRAEEVWVMVGDGERWQRRASVALGG